MLTEEFFGEIVSLAFGLCIIQYCCTVLTIGFKVTHEVENLGSPFSLIGCHCWKSCSLDIRSRELHFVLSLFAGFDFVPHFILVAES